jgi:large subunit ribosomal protein L31
MLSVVKISHVWWPASGWLAMRPYFKGNPMKQDIHPKYEEITATCSCGNVVKVRSTLGKDINLDVCSACHPFYTGKQRNVDTGGRVDRFKKRFGALGKK